MSVEIPVCHGVTLEQYAGITAALADGLPLREALTLEGLNESAWRRADRTWKDRLASGGIEGPLFTAFQRKRIEAEDWLDRPVVPLADNLRAWISFLHAWSTHPAPFALLEGAGLRMADIARLQRRWTHRIEGDDRLQKEAADLAHQGAGPLPTITVGTAELRPFPWSRGASPSATGDKKREPGLAGTGDDLFALLLPLDHYATVCAMLAEPSPDRARVLARFGVDEARFIALDAAWKRRLGADEGQARDYRRLFGHQRSRLRAAALGGTALAVDVPRRPALPFVEEDAPPAIATASGEPRPKRPAATLGGTALAVHVPRGPTLPFAGNQEPARAPSTLGGTSLAVAVPRGPALPFVEQGASSAIAAPSNEPRPLRPAPALGGTSLSVEAPHGPALPFHEGASGQDPRPRPRAPLEPVTEPTRGEAPVASKPNKLAQMRVFTLPEGLRPKPASPDPPATAQLTLQQYASLCVELAGAPTRSAETLARYRLTPPQREILDRHFQERCAREPGLRAAWEQACETYRNWLATLPGRR